MYYRTFSIYYGVFKSRLSFKTLLGVDLMEIDDFSTYWFYQRSKLIKNKKVDNFVNTTTTITTTTNC